MASRDKHYISEKEGRYIGNILNKNMSKFEIGPYGLLRGFVDFCDTKSDIDNALQNFDEYLNRYYILLGTDNKLYTFTNHMKDLNKRV